VQQKLSPLEALVRELEHRKKIAEKRETAAKAVQEEQNRQRRCEADGLAPTIPDPEATKPSEWQDEMDGPWQPPPINNPKCGTEGAKAKPTDDKPKATSGDMKVAVVNEAASDIIISWVADDGGLKWIHSLEAAQQHEINSHTGHTFEVTFARPRAMYLEGGHWEHETWKMQPGGKTARFTLPGRKCKLTVKVLPNLETQDSCADAVPVEAGKKETPPAVEENTPKPSELNANERHALAAAESEPEPKAAPPPPKEKPTPPKKAVLEEKPIEDPEAKFLRGEHGTRDAELKKLKNEASELEKTAKVDYGPSQHYAQMREVCAELSLREYKYEICAFKQVNQGGTSLGTWDGWQNGSAYRTMLYKGGLKCWNAGQRESKVHLVCGHKTEVLSVDEPETCKYELQMATPAACRPRRAALLRVQVQQMLQ